MRILILSILLIPCVLTALIPHDVRAQEKTVIGSSCTTGASAYDWDTTFQCINGTWQYAALKVSTSNASCSSSTAGTMQWTNNQASVCDGTNWKSMNANWFVSGTTTYYNTGNVGIGTSSPQATVDINGTLKLALNTASPTTCTSTTQGTLALTHLGAICVGNTSSSWAFLLTGLSCIW